MERGESIIRDITYSIISDSKKETIKKTKLRCVCMVEYLFIRTVIRHQIILHNGKQNITTQALVV
jgi:hypothetical protein